jgi:hypothetical protein
MSSKYVTVRAMKAYKRSGVKLQSVLTSGVEGDEWLASSPGRTTPKASSWRYPD